MMRGLFLIMLGMLLSMCCLAVSEREVAAQPDWLSSGRCMLGVPVQGARLKGRAPEGQGGPFRVQSGSEVLWEGAAGEEFCVELPRSVRRVYLLSTHGRNLAWKEMVWQGKPVKKHTGQGGDVITLSVDKEAGITPGEQDAGPALRRLLTKARRLMSTGKAAPRCVRLVFPKGVYHFYPAGALPMSFYVSNHDQQDVSPVGVPLVDLADVELDGQDSVFVFHGKMQPFLLMDCERIRVKNIRISYNVPYYAEGEIVEIAEGKTTLKFGAPFRWKVANGRFRILRDDGEDGVNAALPFEKDGPMVPRNGSGDIGWTDRAEQVGEDKVRFEADAGRHGLKVGQVMVLRHGGRPHPAMMMYRAKASLLEEVVFHDSQGMALLAQRSEGITIKGGGCVTAEGRVYTASADATHFSNCRGEIKTTGALYEGMMDDAINVHSTCLSIKKIESPTSLVVRYMHRQSVGFEVFRPGERLQFIKGKTLENLPELGRAEAVEKLDEQHLRITLKNPLPAGISEGDAVENADWYPSVTFKNNVVRYNRARGCLFTTPKPVLVEGNRFIRSHGSAILLAGDAQGWYESGRCLDVKILNNLFDHNLTAKYQFTEAVISIYPEVRELARQQERYHRHILIEGNTFRTHRVPLLYAQSAEDITWRNNKVLYDNLFFPIRNGEPFVFRDPKPTQSNIPSTP